MLDQSPMMPVHSIPPEENTFETVMVDITHKCNMACANCYLPDRTPPDMDIKRLASQPGGRVWLKLTNWQANSRGKVDPGSLRRGKLKDDGSICRMFE